MLHGKRSTSASLLIFSLLLLTPLPASAQAGSLDPTFGNGGIVTTDFGDQSNSNKATANAVVLQPDGKILVCGGIPGSTGFPIGALARYNANGSLDTTFGNAGIAGTSGISTLTAMALQPDGKIVGIGSDFVVRYLSNGTLDSTFGTNGIVSLGVFFGTPTGGVLVQPDGKILVANNELLRFLPGGQFDTGFGNDGMAQVAGHAATGLALLPNGNILVSSFLSVSQGITQYDASGALDTTFGINGQLASVGPANALVLLGSGKILSAGSLITTVAATGSSTGISVARYLGVGATDISFGTNGGAVTPIPGYSTVTTSRMAVQSSGDIVALGTVSMYPLTAFALARYTPAGQLDTTFGIDGTVVTSFGNATVSANGIAIQSDGKIVAVGSYLLTVPHGLFDTAFRVVRYLN
jgi:uncharacterized delta-60 repeat protein